MAVVVDANVVVALAVDDARAPAAAELFATWVRDRESIYAPVLAEYEIVNALTRLTVANASPVSRLDEAWQLIGALPIEYHRMCSGQAVTSAALKLNGHSAYDAAYLALASELGASLWTFDGPLAQRDQRRILCSSCSMTPHV